MTRGSSSSSQIQSINQWSTGGRGKESVDMVYGGTQGKRRPKELKEGGAVKIWLRLERKRDRKEVNGEREEHK